MNLSGPFIKRPVATMLLSLAIMLLGGVSFGAQAADRSGGRYPDGAPAIHGQAEPTPAGARGR